MESETPILPAVPELTPLQTLTELIRICYSAVNWPGAKTDRDRDNWFYKMLADGKLADHVYALTLDCLRGDIHLPNSVLDSLFWSFLAIREDRPLRKKRRRRLMRAWRSLICISTRQIAKTNDRDAGVKIVAANKRKRLSTEESYRRIEEYLTKNARHTGKCKTPKIIEATGVSRGTLSGCPAWQTYQNNKPGRKKPSQLTDDELQMVAMMRESKKEEYEDTIRAKKGKSS